MDQQNKLEQLSRVRRKILLWAPPTIGAISLPTHAQMTCMAEPVVTVTSDPKCETSNQGVIEGAAMLTLLSNDASCPVNIVAIMHDASDPNFIELSSNSGEITSTDGITITWTGTSSAEMPCLPETNVNFVVRYEIDNNGNTDTIVFNLLTEFTN